MNEKTAELDSEHVVEIQTSDGRTIIRKHDGPIICYESEIDAEDLIPKPKKPKMSEIEELFPDFDAEWGDVDFAKKQKQIIVEVGTPCLKKGILKKNGIVSKNEIRNPNINEIEELFPESDVKWGYVNFAKKLNDRENGHPLLEKENGVVLKKRIRWDPKTIFIDREQKTGRCHRFILKSEVLYDKNLIITWKRITIVCLVFSKI